MRLHMGQAIDMAAKSIDSNSDAVRMAYIERSGQSLCARIVFFETLHTVIGQLVDDF